MERSISPVDFRLFFNRFVRKVDMGYEIQIPHIPGFLQECDRIAPLIIQCLSEKTLMPLARVRLLNDFGALSLIVSCASDKGTYEHAKKVQKSYLRKGPFSSDSAWSLAEKEHPLVHHCATFWRGTLWDPPSPVELCTQADIMRYLFAIASKTPAVVDAKRYKAVQEFVHHPYVVNDPTTTRILVELFDKHWFHPNSQIKILEFEDTPVIKVVYTGSITSR